MKDKFVSWALETEMIACASISSGSGLLHARLTGIFGFCGPLYRWMGTSGTISSFISFFLRRVIALDVSQLLSDWCVCIWVRIIARACVDCRPFERIYWHQNCRPLLVPAPSHCLIFLLVPSSEMLHGLQMPWIAESHQSSSMSDFSRITTPRTT